MSTSTFKISKSRRLAIYERDGFTCKDCGFSASRAAVEHRLEMLALHGNAWAKRNSGPRFLTLDHVLPRSRGGSNEDENLQTRCNLCNTAKGSRVPEDVRHLARAKPSKARRKRARADRSTECPPIRIGHVYVDATGDTYYFDPTWHGSDRSALPGVI